MGLPFLRPMDIDPLGPSDRAHRALFLSSSIAPFTPFGSSLSAEGANWGDRQINTCWRFDVHGLIAKISVWIVTDLIGMTVEIKSRRWQGLWDDGWNVKHTVTRFMGWQFGKNEVVRCTEFWQAAQKHLWCMTRVVFRLIFISNRSIASSSVHFSYKNPHPSSHFSIFRRKHIVRASPSSLSEIHPFNSCIIRSHPLTLFLGK